MSYKYKEETMKRYIKNILEESLIDEVVVDKEWNRLYSTIQEKECTKERRNTNFISLRFLTYVAAAFIGFILTFPVVKNMLENSDEMETYQMITRKGEQCFLRLPDGSKVWTNNCTTVEYNSGFGKNNRDISLKGEAYFEVAKGKDLPFVVHTNDINVRAIGTAFNVLAYPSDKQVVTTLYEGKVVVNSASDDEELFLKENQVAVYTKYDNKIHKRSYNKSVDGGWREGNFVFNMISLQEITNILERNYDVCFVFENEKIKNLKFKGVFKKSESLQEILNIITLNTGIGYQTYKDTIIVK